MSLVTVKPGKDSTIILFFFLKNLFYKNIEAGIGEILKIF